MPDICDLILDDHEIFRRRFAELDDERRSGADVVCALWEPLAEHLERHANAEEDIFYPSLLKRGSDAEEETDDAIRDHNKIREAVRSAADMDPGSDEWWDAVQKAREENSDHMAEEERGPLADFRQHASREVRNDLGGRYVAFNSEHAGGRDVDTTDKDPDEFIKEHSPS
jgi:hypothetical protein